MQCTGKIPAYPWPVTCTYPAEIGSTVGGSYSPDVDALAIWLDTGTSVGTKELEPGVYIDLNDRGLIVSLEALDASTRIDHTFLEQLPCPGTRPRMTLMPKKRCDLIAPMPAGAVCLQSGEAQ